MRGAVVRLRAVSVGHGVEAAVKDAPVALAERTTRLVTLAGAIRHATAMLEAVRAVRLQLAGAAVGLGAPGLEMGIAEGIETAIGANKARTVAVGNAALGVLATAIGADGLERADAVVACVRLAEAAVGVPVGGRRALQGVALNVLLAAALDVVVDASGAIVFGAAV